MFRVGERARESSRGRRRLPTRDSRSLKIASHSLSDYAAVPSVSQTASSRVRLSGDPKPPLCGRPAAALRRNVALHPARISRPRSESRGLAGHLRAKCHWRTLPLNRQPQTRRKKPRKLSRLADLFRSFARFISVRSRTRHAARHARARRVRGRRPTSEFRRLHRLAGGFADRKRCRVASPDTYPRTIVPRSSVSIAD